MQPQLWCAWESSTVIGSVRWYSELCTQNHRSSHATNLNNISTGDFLRGYPGGGYNRALYYEKLTAAQKRQNQRDYRRRFTNPFRTQAEENAERQRKHDQGMEFGMTGGIQDPANRQHGYHEYMLDRQNKLDSWGANYDALAIDPLDGKRDYDPLHYEHYSGTPYDHDMSNPWDD